LMACLFFCNPCAHAELHQQKSAQKLCSTTLICKLILCDCDRSIFDSSTLIFNGKQFLLSQEVQEVAEGRRQEKRLNFGCNVSTS